MYACVCGSECASMSEETCGWCCWDELSAALDAPPSDTAHLRCPPPLRYHPTFYPPKTTAGSVLRGPSLKHKSARSALLFKGAFLLNRARKRKSISQQLVHIWFSICFYRQWSKIIIIYTISFTADCLYFLLYFSNILQLLKWSCVQKINNVKQKTLSSRLSTEQSTI